MNEEQKASIEFLHQTLGSVKTPKVLVVDDDDNDMALHLRVLREFDCEVVVAGSADKAIELIREDGIDLILLDAKLPGHPAADVVAVAAGLAPDASVVIVTGYPDSATKSVAIRKGAKLILSKPLTEETVSAFLNRRPTPPLLPSC